MDNLLELTLTVSDDQNDPKTIEENTLLLTNNLREFEIASINRKGNREIPHGVKGDAITLGAIVISLSAAVLPEIISFLQNWVNERRRIKIEAPNGYKIDFVPDKKYSEKELLNLAKKLNHLKK